jgi:hypothetical protein
MRPSRRSVAPPHSALGLRLGGDIVRLVPPVRQGPTPSEGLATATAKGSEDLLPGRGLVPEPPPVKAGGIIVGTSTLICRGHNHRQTRAAAKLLQATTSSGRSGGRLWRETAGDRTCRGHSLGVDRENGGFQSFSWRAHRRS